MRIVPGGGLLCLAVLLFFCGCTKGGPQNSAAVSALPPLTSSSFLDLLDDHAIQPLEGAKLLQVRAAPPFRFTHTENGEISTGQSFIRFGRVITGTADIHPSWGNFTLLLHPLTDVRQADPTNAQLLLYDPKGEPSLVGALALETVTPFGKRLSFEDQGREPEQNFIQWILQRCLPTVPLVPGTGLRQGHLIAERKQILWLDLETHSRVTVEGQGTYRQRPVIVLRLEGDAEEPHQKKVGTVIGFAFLDEKAGIMAYENIDVTVLQKSRGRTIHMQLMSAFDLP